jgi:hypothetical protein
MHKVRVASATPYRWMSFLDYWFTSKHGTRRKPSITPRHASVLISRSALLRSSPARGGRAQLSRSNGGRGLCQFSANNSPRACPHTPSISSQLTPTASSQTAPSPSLAHPDRDRPHMPSRRLNRFPAECRRFDSDHPLHSLGRPSPGLGHFVECDERGRFIPC